MIPGNLLVAHLSDLHWSNERIEEKYRCSRNMVDALYESAPDIIIVAGDSFDHSVRMEDVAARHSTGFFSELARIAPTFVIKGNYSHDRNSVEMLEFVAPESGKLLVSTEPEIYTFDRLVQPALMRIPFSEALMSPDVLTADAVIFTLPYPSQAFLAKASTMSPGDMRLAVSKAITDVIKGYAAVQVAPGVPRILVFHGTVKEAMISASQHAMGMDIELTIADIEACGFHLVCAGHLHFAQKIGDCTFYPGGMSYTSYGDEGEKGFWLHMLKPGCDPWPSVGLESRHVSSGARPMKIVNVDLADPFFEVPDTGDADIQVRVAMTEADRERLNQTDWKEMFPDAGAIKIVPTVQQIESIRCDEVRAAQKLREKISAWDSHHVRMAEAPSLITDRLLVKADMLESMSADTIIQGMKERDDASR